MMIKRYSLLVVLLVFVTVSCSDTVDGPDPLETASVFVTNEGNFSDGNGSVTSYDPQAASSQTQAFQNENNRPMAGLVQSSEVSGDRMFLAVNSTDKVEVVNKLTLESLATVEFNAPPTAVEVVDETAYVTTYNFETQNDQVYLFDLSTMEVADDSIEVSSAPRDIVVAGGSLYVSTNSGNTVEVIDPETNTVERSITVGQGPSQLIVDNEDRIWVACNGRVSYDESTEDVPGSVHVLNGQTGEVIGSVESPDIAATGYNYRLALNENAQEAYFLSDGVSVIDMNNFTLSDTKLTTRSFNAIGYFAAQNQLYLGQSNGYSQAGKALLYDLEGTAVDSFTAGIAPNGFQFTQE